MVVFRFWDRTWGPFRESKFLFSQNLTYSYSFSGCNLPAIAMSSESLHNYFGITVKSGKNYEKFGVSNFDRDAEIMMKWLQHHGNLQKISPQKTLRSTFFSTKKKIPSDIPKSSFSDFETKLRPLSGIDISFFSKFNLLVPFCGVKFTGNYHVIGIIT